MLVALLTAHARAASDPERDVLIRWLADYVVAKPNISTNRLIWEPEFNRLLDNAVPNPIPLYLGMTPNREVETLRYHLGTVLGGPPNPVRVTEERYITASACRPHSCPEKGLVWVDTATSQLVVVVRHFLYQDQRRSLDSGDLMIATKDRADFHDLPSAFFQELKSWLDAEKNSIPRYDIQPAYVRFAGNRNTIVDVTDMYRRVVQQ
ncbi:MAG: hypothetical protein OJJ21_03395 [Ferrovibrio sp.]|uniref:hypothetical protein n=1 Tax=Ferrovibrio sp. TaxID=1917215 RepID=UPI00261360BD|nr:hypothetical protein [Ferrovibrio sp.]MCW0232623.1 hypothetical protein [Ferrovibrio sp.]